MSAGTIGVEAITPDLRRMLAGRETRVTRVTHAVVARHGEDRPTILATARSAGHLARAAAELARTYAATHVPYDTSSLVPVVAAGDCHWCGERAEVVTTQVGGREVAYVRHVVPAATGDRYAHPAIVLGVAR